MRTKSKARPVEPGGLMEESFHEQLIKGRHAATLAWLKVNRNWWSLAFCGVLLVAFVSSLGWQKAADRFANNVRVEWVKLSPNGTYTVEFADEGKPIEFFQTTVDSKLSEWVEKRYSRMRTTIGTDFGFAALFMSDPMREQFLTKEDDIGAAKVAVKLQGCGDCEQKEVKVRNLQTLDKDPLPGKRGGKDGKGEKDDQNLYTTLAFVIERTLNKEGQVAECKNKIITLLWRFRTKEETAQRKDELRANPLGQEFDRASVRDDPTPVKAEECAKR